MVTVELCIGSSCFVKGSNSLIEMLKELLKEKGWEEKVVLKGAFCMQTCTHGLGVRINGEHIYDLGLHNAREIIERKIQEALEISGS